VTANPDRYAYGPYHDGPDPLAPPIDLRSALDEIGREVMEGSSPTSAMRELLRRGVGDRPGLDDLTRRLWQRRSQLQRRHRVDGTLEEVRKLLRRALDAERKALFPDPSDDARFAEAQLDALPSNPAGAVRELDQYDWRSSEARQAYQQIRELLGQELLDQRFQGMKQALQGAGPEQLEQVRRMLADLNQLLAAHARGDADTQQRFEEFMRKHGEFFPEQPRDVEELIDLLAARSAAAQRLLNAMTPEQRAELAGLAQQAFGDPRLAQQLSQLDAQLQSLRPGEDWTSAGGRFRGNDPLGLGEATSAVQELSELDALAEQLSQSYPGARLEDVDLDALVRHLGEQAGVDARRLAELERELSRQGVLERGPDGALRLSPKALRRLGEAALRDVVERLARRGDRDTRRAGAAGEPTGGSRPWVFGDTEPWDASRTVRNAVLRRAAHGGQGPRLSVEDLEISETEQRSRAAVALCVDVSWSMVQDDRWVPMKRTALALHQLVTTRFRSDALQLITFGRVAAPIGIAELTGLEGVWEQGTNLHHALALAGRHLRRHPDAQPVVLVVTDGEPTAHLDAAGEVVFRYPPGRDTLAHTVAEFDRVARLGAAITIFRLGDEPRLAMFVDRVARRCGGRVVTPSSDGLSAEVVGDYLHARRRS
jgi:uncharacterized protein with von Willebrand factor type A (vWA) domain